MLVTFHKWFHFLLRVAVSSECACACVSLRMCCVCMCVFFCVCMFEKRNVRRNPGGLSILTCKSFDTHGEGGERQNRTISQLVPSNDPYPENSSLTASSGKVNDWGESGTCCSQPILKHEMSEPFVQVITCSFFACFFDEKCEADDDLALSHAPRVYVQNVSVFAGSTRTCVSTCGRRARTHGGVLNVHTVVFPLSHTTHTAHTPQHETQQQHTTTHEDRARDRQRKKTERSFRCICLVYPRFDVSL